MKVLEKISDFAGKWMAIIALAVAIIAFVAPAPVHAALPTSWVNPLLGIVMFGMGMTLKLGDFKVVFTKPKAVITGILSQFIIMPLIAWVPSVMEGCCSSTAATRPAQARDLVRVIIRDASLISSTMIWSI